MRAESSLARPGAERGWTLAEVVGTTPTPEFAAMVAEEYLLRLAQLDDPLLQALATAKMQGYSNHDIAQQLGCSVRTVERRLELIRKKWDENNPHEQ